MLVLHTDQDRKDFAPGESICGYFGWNLEHPPRDAFLRLFWFTEGRGSNDVGIVEEQEEPSPPAVFEGRFEFLLPAGPYSFSGKLITLQWGLELVLNRGKDVTRIVLLVSPWETEVVLPREAAKAD